MGNIHIHITTGDKNYFKTWLGDLGSGSVSKALVWYKHGNLSLIPSMHRGEKPYKAGAGDADTSRSLGLAGCFIVSKSTLSQ